MIPAPLVLSLEVNKDKKIRKNENDDTIIKAVITIAAGITVRTAEK